MIVLRPRFPPISHFQHRKMEWGVAVAMIGWCVILAQPNETLTQPQFSVLREWGSETFWTWVCGLIGGARLLSLWVNGAWGPSPIVRGVTAAASCLFWTAVVMGVAASHRVATSLAIYPLLILADIDSAYHAAADWRLTLDRRREVAYARSHAH